MQSAKDDRLHHGSPLCRRLIQGYGLCRFLQLQGRYQYYNGDPNMARDVDQSPDV